MSSKPIVFMSSPLFPEARELLAEHFTLHIGAGSNSAENQRQLQQQTDAVAAIITLSDHYDQKAIAALPSSLRALATYSVGTDHIDLAAAQARNLVVLSTPDVLTESCADTALLLMLGAARRAWEGLKLVKGGQWTGWAPDQLLGKDVWGQRLGIFGMGRIGQAIARRARGFGMQLHYHNRRQLPAAKEQGAHYHHTLAELAAQSDFFCIACPPSPATRGIISSDILQMLPPGAVVVNIARGDMVDDPALLAALKNGKVAAAGLDVFAGEPAVHPDWKTLDNVFTLPHLGSATLATRLSMAALLRDGLLTVLAETRPK